MQTILPLHLAFLHSMMMLTTVMMMLTLIGHLDAFETTRNPTTESNPCAGDPEKVCGKDGDGRKQANAIAKTFSNSHNIDLMFVICMTQDCLDTNGPNSTLQKTFTSFIVELLDFLTCSYDLANVRVSVVAYNFLETWIAFNGIGVDSPTTECQFKDVISNLEIRSDNKSNQTCLLGEALHVAKDIFNNSTQRRNAKRVAWILSDAKNCAPGKNSTTLSDLMPYYKSRTLEGAAALKTFNVTVFTVGISRCPRGFFDSLLKEDLLMTIATSNDSHFACINSWTNVTSNGGCHCLNGSISNCNFTSTFSAVTENYPKSEVVWIGVGVGTGVVVIIVVVVVIIIVVIACSRRRNRREHKRGHAPPIPEKKPPVPQLTIRADATGTDYVNTEDDDVKEIDYEIMECERQMNGWSSHLEMLKNDFNILDLGIYSLEGDYFAQTPGFSLSPQERKKIIEIMESHHHHHQFLSISVALTEFTVDNGTLSESSLSAKSSDKVLQVVYRDGYMAIGVARLNQGSGCQSAVEKVLDDVTRQLF